MANFIEVTVGTEKCLVNLAQVYKIVPVVNGVGCILHFDNGKTQNSSDQYDVIKTVLTGNPKTVLTEEVKTIKKDVEKVKS